MTDPMVDLTVPTIDCCSELAQMQADHPQSPNWSMSPGTINTWGGPPPLRFLLTGCPIAEPQPGRRHGRRQLFVTTSDDRRAPAEVAAAGA